MLSSTSDKVVNFRNSIDESTLALKMQGHNSKSNQSKQALNEQYSNSNATPHFEVDQAY